MRIDILTIFPEMFSNILSSSILGRAASKGILKFKTHNIRDFSQNKHRNTDDYPFGGGSRFLTASKASQPKLLKSRAAL